MKRLRLVLVCSSDSSLGDRLTAMLHGLAQVQRVPGASGIGPVLERFPVSVVLIDLRQPDTPPLVEELRHLRPALPIIALGPLRSEPRRMAEAQEVFAVDEADADPARLRQLTALALEQRRLTEELDAVHLSSSEAPNENGQKIRVSPDTAWNESGRPLVRALRSVERPEDVWENVLDWIASSTRVSRVGIFFAEEDGTFRLRAGLRCLPETGKLEFDREDPLVRWCETRLHLVARITLGALGDVAERRVLQQALDAMGAEILAPLHVRNRLLGWVLIGNRASGIPFDPGDLERFVVLVDQVSRVIENTLLYEEAVLQKTTAETLLESIPIGIVSAGYDASIRGCNAAAERMLGGFASTLIGQPVEALGGRLGDLLRRALAGESADSEAWAHPTGRSLVLSARRLEHAGGYLGAMALITDITAREELEGREQRLERMRFWTELAAGMSHEIRNPLVAIKTFAQLLPERYMDEDFRKECSTLLSSEADRLNAIVEQITNFASPPPLNKQAVPLEPLIRRALRLCEKDATLPSLPCKVEIENPLPTIQADTQSLAEALSHLLRNAAEAVAGRKGGLAEIRARFLSNRPRPVIEISVSDNGPGMSDAIRERPFSPFTTTKNRGMGLGLAIVQRTALDHGGRVELDSHARGTRVSILLPVVSPSESVPTGR